MKLLVIEDDVSLGRGIRAGLTLRAHEVEWLTDGASADEALRRATYDALILDLKLPDRSGLDLLRDMRLRGDDTPVLVLTALDAVSDRVRGLDAGGDDYLTKPFDLDELSARLRALKRRHRAAPSSVLRHGDVTLNLDAHTVIRAGKPVPVSPHEFAILRLLLVNAGQALPRSRLEQALYGWSAEIESNTVEVFVHFLRKKLGDDLIRTVRGIGYLIERAG